MKDKTLFGKKLTERITRKHTLPAYLILFFLAILVVFLVVLVNLFVTSERELAVEKYIEEQNKEDLMSMDLSDVKEWGLKNLIIMGVKGAPVLALVLSFTLLIHGFKLVGR